MDEVTEQANYRKGTYTERCDGCYWYSNFTSMITGKVTHNCSEFVKRGSGFENAPGGLCDYYKEDL
jgi:hypothetical protein